MPLPDERPRQSVANLIGRFEQQVKRQASPAPPVVPRSSSVSSQIAGDAAKEEAKEKKEWPPKSVASIDNKPLAHSLPIPPPTPSPKMYNSPALSPQPTPDVAPSLSPPPENVVATLAPTPASPEPEPAKTAPSKTKPVSTGKSIPAAPARRTTMSPAKSRSPVPNTSIKSAVTSSFPKTSLQSSVSQPIKPQHTGQSVTSNSGTARSPRTTPRTAPSTPSRPRPTAQTQPQARPKTPSSGLFAPTAASLARSRNAPPPPLPHTKKVTLSNEVAERLSKPTAASLSKARTTTAPAQTPSRVTKSASGSAPHGATPRGTPKLKVGRIPVKTKEADIKQAVKSGAPSTSSEPSRASDHPVDDHPENEHESGTSAFSNGSLPDDVHGSSEVASEGQQEPAIASERGEHHEDVFSDSEVQHEPPAGEQTTEGALHADEHSDQGGEEEGHHGIHLEIHQDTVPESTDSHADTLLRNGDAVKVELSAPSVRNDIEDIVNLLEVSSVSKARPHSIVSIPDEDIAGEY